MSMSEDGSSNSSSLWVFGTSKGVIRAEPESISPMLKARDQTHISNLQSQGLDRHRVGLGKRLSGRASKSPTRSPETKPLVPENREQQSPQALDYQQLHDDLLSRLSQWLQDEKLKRANANPGPQATSSPTTQIGSDNAEKTIPLTLPAPNKGSDSDAALEKLENIIKESDLLAHRLPKGSSFDRRQSSSYRRLSLRARARRLSHTAGSSDTEYVDGDASIPSVDAVLDNRKTLGFVGGAANSEHDLTRTISRSVKADSWLEFKNEIIRLTHTLRLKGWRGVPLRSGADIDVQRLSGALTNAVYVVTPPKGPAKTPGDGSKISDDHNKSIKRTPRKLLLRIYGPQSEHLIDREGELRILKRLARKKIGPRLLGTFNNGRFEEYLNAQTLSAEDLRQSETSKQIAKRMRELHDGIELLDRERSAGPYVWQTWDKWVSRCGEVVTWLDSQILAGQGLVSSTQSWKNRGLVCGVEWAKFRKAVEMYRKWLTKSYGSERRIQDQLVFSHNDTQYGNLLRLVPSGESPLLLPANEHRQLVVIDFEYANANHPGLEFANHFTEWCYNYHSPTHSYACNTSIYPTPKEQERFLYAYVNHMPHFSSPSTKPALQKSTSSISSFMLDSRGPPTSYDTEESAREESARRRVKSLMKETRLWRVANSAQWIAWGIVQARVPGMDEALKTSRKESSTDADNSLPSAAGPGDPPRDNESIPSPRTPRADEKLDNDNDAEVELDAEYDYLAYAQQRALFFWGDLLELGLIKDEDLPANVLKEVKRVPY